MPTICISCAAAPRVVFEESLEVPEGCSLVEAVRACGLSPAYPSLDWQALSPGIWGRAVDWSHPLNEGDRVELCRPLRVDPKVARRERFKRQGTRGTGLFARRRNEGQGGR